VSTEKAVDHARLDAVARGRVQGVGFRMFVLRRARDHGLVGWVANEPDGSVRCVAEGPRDALGRLLADVRRGPPGSRVGEVRETWSEAGGAFTSFGVRPGSHPGD
jgi:acylphosphatase